MATSPSSASARAGKPSPPSPRRWRFVISSQRDRSGASSMAMQQNSPANFSSQPGTTVDPAEVAKFSKLSDEWWDPNGKMAPLHRINPLRLSYIRDAACRKFERNVKSLNCLSGLRILDIGCGAGLLCEPFTRLGALVIGVDPSASNIAAAMLNPGGMTVISTLNRNWKSFALAIVGAEYVLRWLPRGTHQWDKFVTPEELEQHLAHNKLSITEQAGVVYSPLADRWSRAADMDVNYMVVAEGA